MGLSFTGSGFPLRISRCKKTKNKKKNKNKNKTKKQNKKQKKKKKKNAFVIVENDHMATDFNGVNAEVYG